MTSETNADVVHRMTVRGFTLIYNYDNTGMIYSYLLILFTKDICVKSPSFPKGISETMKYRK